MKRTLELFDLVLGHRRVSYWPLQASMPPLPIWENVGGDFECVSTLEVGYC